MLSDHAFFLKNEKRFAILAVNTSKNALTNLRFISVIRFFRRHHTPETFFLPYLQFSALLFKLNEFDLDKINPIQYDPNNDGLKVSLVCTTDFAEFSVYKKYRFEEILVVDNGSFMDRPLFEAPKIENQEFWLKFNKPLDNVETLHEFLRREGSDTNEETK